MILYLPQLADEVQDLLISSHHHRNLFATEGRHRE